MPWVRQQRLSGWHIFLVVHFPSVPLWQPASAEQRAQCIAWGRHHFEAWAQGLDVETAQAIAEFKMQSDSFNNFLRDQSSFSHSPEYQRELASKIRLLSRALYSVMIPHEITVYRGLRGPFPKDLAEGKGIFDGSFMATSMLLDTAEQFSCWEDPDDIATILAIQVPTGHPGAWIEQLLDEEVREYEVLLPPTTELVVTEVSRVSFDYKPLPVGFGSDQTAPVRRVALCRCR